MLHISVCSVLYQTKKNNLKRIFIHSKYNYSKSETCLPQKPWHFIQLLLISTVPYEYVKNTLKYIHPFVKTMYPVKVTADVSSERFTFIVFHDYHFILTSHAIQR